MMKLYLSSYGIPDIDALARLVGKPLHDISVAMVSNAKDQYNDLLRTYKAGGAADKLAAQGFRRVDQIDLRTFGDTEELANTLRVYDVIWSCGGNVFCLRTEMRRSGFDEIISDLLAAGIVYGGESAGAMVTGRTLRGTEVADHPQAVAEPVWDGLRLIDLVLMPHADSVAFSEAVRHMRGLYAGDGSYLELQDGQALLVDGHARRVIGRSSQPVPNV